MLFGRAPVEAEGLRIPGVCTGCGAGRWEGREGCVSELAFLTGDFSEVGLLEMVTPRLVFRPRCLRSLAATHSGQSGSLHCCTTTFFFFFGVGAVIGASLVTALSVALRLFEPVEVWELLPSVVAIDFGLAATVSVTELVVVVVRVE